MTNCFQAFSEFVGSHFLLLCSQGSMCRCNVQVKFHLGPRNQSWNPLQMQRVHKMSLTIDNFPYVNLFFFCIIAILSPETLHVINKGPQMFMFFSHSTYLSQVRNTKPSVSLGCISRKASNKDAWKKQLVACRQVLGEMIM